MLKLHKKTAFIQMSSLLRIINMQMLPTFDVQVYIFNFPATNTEQILKIWKILNWTAK